MKQRTVLWKISSYCSLAALLACAGPAAVQAADGTAPAPATSPAPAAPDLLKPITQVGAWNFGQYEGGKGEMAVDGDALRIAVAKATGTDWHVQVSQAVSGLENGKTYTLTFRARADRLRDLPIYSLVGAGDFHAIGLNTRVSLSERWRRFTCSFTAAKLSTEPNVADILPTFMLGAEPGTVWLSNVELRAGAPTTPPDSDASSVPDLGEAQFAGMSFVRIPAGSFQRGTTDPQRQALTKAGMWTPTNSVEEPARTIHISHPFYLSQYLVSQAIYKSIVGSDPSVFQGDDLPVDSVTWNDAEAFCKALNAKAGGKAHYRLPTEAEWEYACRAGSNDLFGNGEEQKPITKDSLNEYAWFASNSGNHTHAPGTRRANAWGLYDMSGDVWQWCEDAFAADYYTRSPADDPLCRDGDTTERVLRGGSWFLDARAQRPAVRGGNVPDFKSPYVGLRIVRDL